MQVKIGFTTARHGLVVHFYLVFFFGQAQHLHGGYLYIDGRRSMGVQLWHALVMAAILLT